MEGYAEHGEGNDSTEQIGFGGSRGRRRGRGLTTFGLKTIGGFFLFLSAASTTLVPLLFGSNTNDMGSLTAMVLCEVVSWCAVPMYAWLLVRGYEHTHSRVIYGMELFVLALACEVPYDMATSGRAFDLGSQNPVFGLFIALAVLALMDWIAERHQGAMRWVLSVVMVLIGLLWDLLLRVGLRQHLMSLGAVTLGFVLIFTLMRKYENTMMLTAGLFGAVMMIAPGFGVLFTHFHNGKLGYRHAWDKWVFYALYPVLLLVCALAA